MPKSTTKRTSTDKGAVHAGSGNVFIDVGLNEGLLAKAELVREIANAIAERGITQTEAAAILGTTQPKVSALLAGDISGFAYERLFRLLRALDRDIRISVTVHRKSPARAKRRALVKA